MLKAILFFSSPGKWPHDKDWSLPLCSVQHLLIHIFNLGAFSSHLSGTPLQHEGKSPTVTWCYHWTFLGWHLLSGFENLETVVVQEMWPQTEWLIFLQEFKVRQRRACLDTAETIIQKLKPQFEHFLQVALSGGNREKMVVNWFWLLIQINLFETPKSVSVSVQIKRSSVNSSTVIFRKLILCNQQIIISWVLWFALCDFMK